MGCTSLGARAWAAYRRGGFSYLSYKVLKRALDGREPLARHLLYASPRWYWEQRGGSDYFQEQEAQSERTARSQFIALEVSRYEPDSLLEIGCGYGKQLLTLRGVLEAPLV